MRDNQIITNDMKKIYSTVMMLAMMVAALSFTACGGDDEVDNGGGEASIVGVWECTYFDFDSDLPGMNADSNMQIGDRIRFKSDGTYEANYKNGETETGSWSLKGNTLTVAADVDISIPFDYKITKLTSTELEFTLDIKFMKLLYRCKRVS